MEKIVYLVDLRDDDGITTAGFISLEEAVAFVEAVGNEFLNPLYLVDAETGEVVDTYNNGEWEGY